MLSQAERMIVALYEQKAGEQIVQLEDKEGKKEQAACITEEARLRLTDTPVLTFKALDSLPFIRHGLSTRLGGVSDDVWQSMNLGFTRGDDENKVRENFKRICKAIGIKDNKLISVSQVHSDKIQLVTKEDCGKGFHIKRDYESADALITNERGVPLVVYVADCVPIYLVDRKNHAIGLVHSGWRGTVLHISAKTILKMKEVFHTDEKDIVAVIGPSICGKCYEVGEEVAEEFHIAFPKEDIPYFLKKKENGKYQLDLWKANEIILRNQGVPASQISVSGVCTSCHNKLLFSHRATQGKRGSLAGFMQIV